MPSSKSTSKTEEISDASSKSIAPKSRSSIVKECWENRPNFQASYGLKMTPKDIEEGNKILEAMEAADKA